MGKSVWCGILGAALLAVSPVSGYALETGMEQETFERQDDASVADGYYTVNMDGNMFSLLIMNGCVYSIDPKSGAYMTRSAEDIQVYTSGNDFLIEDGDEGVMALIRQEGKGESDTGGMYYAMYTDWRGADTEAEFEEGQDVRIGGYVFGNDYYVADKKPLSVFFQIKPAQEDEIAKAKMEGSGFDTPEDAVTFYIDRFKEMDIDGMISAYAMESFAEHYRMDLELRRMLYSVAYRPWIWQRDSYLEPLNLESRRSMLIEGIRVEYLSLILNASSEYADYNATSLTIDVTYDEDVEQALNEILLEVEEGFFERIVLKKFDTLEEIVKEVFQGENETIQKNLERYREERYPSDLEAYREIYGLEDYRPVSVWLQLDGRDWLMTFDTAEYNGRWYLFYPYAVITNYISVDLVDPLIDFERIRGEYTYTEQESES